MANAFSLFRSFITGKLFPKLSKLKNNRSFRPGLLTLEDRVTPANVDLSGATGWTPIMFGATKDYADDSQAGAADTDIIGDATHGSLYTAFDDNNTASGADDTLVFRMRINNPTSTTNFAGVAIVGMDANLDGRVDIFLSVDGRNNGQAIRIFDPGTGLNQSPNTTTTSPLPVGILPNNGVYPFNANNYAVVPVSATSDPNWNGNSDLSSDGKSDAFISWRLPISDLATVLAKPSPVDRSGNYGPRGSTGIAGYTKDTTVQYVNFTQTQTGPINGDLNGAPRNYDGALTFSALGATTTPMSASNPLPAATVININEPIGDGNLSASESTSITISGTTNAAPGSTIQLAISDSNVGTSDVATTATVILGANGVNTWSVSGVNVSSQADGSLTVTASVTVASNTVSDTATVALDKTGPALAINTLPTAISGRPTFTGTTDLPPGSTLTVTIDPDNDPATNNNIVYSTLVLPGGTWSLNTNLQTPISGTIPAGGLVSYTKVTVSGTDAAGNPSTATILNKPTVNTLSTNDTTPVVTGNWTNIPGDSLAVTVDGVSYTPTITGNNWTVLVTSPLPAGSSYEVVATVTRMSTTVTDTTTAELTITSAAVVTIAITSGTTSSDTTPVITGTSNILTGTIIVQIDPNNDGNLADAVTYSTTTNGSGAWSLDTGDISKLISGTIPNGGYLGTVHVYAENIAHTATADQVLTISTPSIAIASITSTATTNGFATVNNSGAAANFLNMTEDDAVTISGTAPDGYTVNLVVTDPNGNFVSQTGISVSGGNWSISGLNLSSLDNGVLTVTATLSGTAITATNTAVTHDKTAPIITITAQDPLKKTAAVITGRTDLPAGTNLTVEVYDGATLKAQWSVTSDSNGYFTTSGVSPSTGSANIGNGGPFTVNVFPTSTTTDLALNITQSTSVTRSGAPNASTNSIMIGTIAGDNQITVNEITSGLVLSGTTTLTAATTSAFTVTVSDGTTTVTVPTGSITNTLGNWTATLTASQVKSFNNGPLTVNASVNDAGILVYDAAFPTLNLPSTVLSITDNVPGLVTGAGTVTFTFTFSEGVTGFDASDVTVTNGTKGAFSGSDTTYTLVVTPTTNSSGTINVSVASGIANGINTGRGNTAATATQDFNTTSAASAPNITIDIDNLATNPSPLITGLTSLTVGAPVLITIDPDNNNSTSNNITYSATVQVDTTWSLNIATDTPDTGSVPFGGLPSYAKITATATNAFALSTTVTGLNKPAVNSLLANTTTPTVTGTWANIPGDSLAVTVNSVSYTPVISGNNWSVAVTNDLATGASYEVIATVTRGADSKVDISSNEVTIDTSAPTIAITSISVDTGVNSLDFSTNDTTLVYSGTAENNATVVVTLQDSQTNVVFSSSVIASGGNWSLDRTGFPLPEGSYTLTATATDAAGNPTSVNQVVVVDLTGPVIAFTSGRSTTSSTPFITGTTNLPAGSTITIKVDHDNDGDYEEVGTNTYTTTVLTGGLWSVQATTAISGTVGVQASGTDDVGNTTTATQPLTLNVSVPVISVYEPLDANGNFDGTLDANEDNAVTISGTSINIPNGGLITVTITDGNITITDTTTVNTNAWSLAVLNLSSLANGTIYVTAGYDLSGDIYSDTASVLHDKLTFTPISIDSISTDSGVIADFITNDQTLIFTGSTTAGASVTVVIKDSSNATVQTFAPITANSAGIFVTPVSISLSEGTYTAEATTSTYTITQSFTVDLTAPNVPTVNTLTTTDTTPSVTGTINLAAGDVLRVTVNNVTYTVGADLTVSGGTWTLQIPGANILPIGTYPVTATVTDIAGNVSTDSTSNELVVNAVNQNPVVTTSGGATSFTEGNNTTSTPVVVDGGVTVTDADSGTLASATVSITSNFQPGEDLLAFVNNPATMGNISASYNSSTGFLTLTSAGATATLAQWQNALRSITYSNASDNPVTSTRTISFVVNDGANNSNSATKAVSVAATNDSPVVTTSGGTTSFTEGNNTTSTPVVVDGGLTVTDADSGTLASATVTISGGFQPGEDLLAFVNNPATMGNISASFNSSTGFLTLTSAGATATLAQWQNALRSITYSNASENPVTSTRTISFVVNDGANNSNAATKQVSVTTTNDSPTISAPGSITVVEDVSTILTGISFADLDAGAGGVSATLSVPSGSLIASTGSGVTITGSNTGILSLSGTIANINTFVAVGNVSYLTAPNGAANKTLTIGIDDLGNTGGPAQSASTTLTLQVESVADVINVTSTTPDGNYKAGDVIQVTVQFDETVTVDTTDGTPSLTLETGATDRTVTYSSGSGTSTLTFTYVVQAGDTTPDLDYVSSTSLVLNGGSIQNATSKDSILTLANPGAAGSLGANKAIVIDTTPPIAGPVDISTPTDTGIDDDKTKHGNPVLTFPGEPGLTITLTGPNGGLIDPSQYTVTYATGTYTVTLVDATLGTGGANDPFGTYSGSTPTNNAANAVDGLYTIKATDPAGNQADVGSFIIDTTPPVAGPVDISTPTDTGIDDDKTKHGNPVLTFPGEPGLTITLTGPNGGLLDPSQYTVTFAAGTYTVTLVDATLGTGGANDPFGTYSGSTPTNNAANATDGLYTIKATDPAGNQADVGSFIIDTIIPTVIITSSVPSLAFGASAVLTITFSEIPVGFDLNDIVVSAGSVSSLTPTIDPKVFTATYTAPNGSGGTESIVITNASYTDLAGNSGAGSTLNQQITVIAPTLVITSDKANLEFGQTATLTFTFSEPPVGFAISDISANNGTLGSLIVNPNDAKVYTVVFTPTKDFIGNGTISVADGSYTNSFAVPGVGASISPPISIHTKIRGFAATGDGSSMGGNRLDPNQNANGTSVVLYDPATGRSSGSTVPFENYKGQVRVSRADTNGDGTLDMVVSTGMGSEPVVKIIDSSNGNVLGQIVAYDKAFTGGVFVSVIDINQDGFSEIVTGAGAGGGPHVKVFDGRTKQEIASFFAYDPSFRGGVSVATKDLDNDGILDIVTGAGPGGSPHVRVYNGATMTLMKEFMAYALNFTGGVYVAVGDFMSDGILEIITGAGAGGGPHLKIWDYQTLNLVGERMVYDNFTLSSGVVVDILFGGGVRVGIADGNDDGILDIITGAGPGGGPHVKVLAGFNLETIRNFFSGEKTDTRGVFVSG